jgi:hypothetical protein|tara:strand:- start:647 stop:1138 length:492 start_codon:yes stop_codon:yes gene_type:complete
MSKRRGITKNMELKKLFTILIFVFFTNYVNAKIIKPAKNFSPYEVVKIQLVALKNNSASSEDSGIKQVWLFAHPENKRVTGPYERFRIMIYGNQYNLLLNHSSHKINLIMNTSKKNIFRVEILTREKKLFFYEWHVEKGDDKNCNDCWFTTAVSIPIDQGNTI